MIWREGGFQCDLQLFMLIKWSQPILTDTTIKHKHQMGNKIGPRCHWVTNQSTQKHLKETVPPPSVILCQKAMKMSLGESDSTPSTHTYTRAHQHTHDLRHSGERKALNSSDPWSSLYTAPSTTARQAGPLLPEIPLLTHPGPAREQKQW